jgi:hypothetical protein
MFGSKIVNPASKSLTPPRAQGLHPADALARTQREHGEQHQRQTHSTEPECDSLTPPPQSRGLLMGPNIMGTQRQRLQTTITSTMAPGVFFMASRNYFREGKQPQTKWYSQGLFL